MQFNEPNPLAVSSLGIAARIGDELSLSILLKKGRRVDVGDNRGWTPIHEAAAAGHVGCLQILLKKGRKHVNQRTMEGETPMLLACIHQNNANLVQVLIIHHSDVNLGNNEDITPLHQVCRLGKLELAKILVECGADINKKDFAKFTPLHSAVSEGRAEIVKYLINRGADINLVDEFGRTPLFVACDHHNWSAVEPLLEVSQCVDSRALDGGTPLMVAAQNGNLKLVEELLKKGANPNLADKYHVMPIHLAVHGGHLSVVQLLLKVTKREAIYRHCKDRMARAGSLCSLAVDGQSLDVLQALLRSDLGDEILHIPLQITHSVPTVRQYGGCCTFSYTESTAISFLLKYQFDNSQTEAVDYLHLLLKHGFPVNAPNRASLPPLIALAISSPDFESVLEQCFNILLDHGADIEYTTERNSVPDALLAACVTGSCPLLLLLLKAGSSGVPSDLLRHLLAAYLPNSLAIRELTEMISLLLKLGVTEPDLRKKAQEVMNTPAKPDIYSLQQLCRIAVRKHLRRPLCQSLSSLELPLSIKNYITFHVI